MLQDMSWQVGFYVNVLDLAGRITGRLEGVEAGSLSFQNSDSGKASGSITVTGAAVESTQWLSVRLQPVHVINGVERSLGVFVPSVPAIRHAGTGAVTAEVQLMDLVSTLASEPLALGTLAMPAGTPIVPIIRVLLQQIGYTNFSAPETDAVTRTPLIWETGTTALRVINDLLGMSGFNSLSTDESGVFTTAPYVLPENRPIAHTLHDDNFSIYLPDFEETRDLYAVPNRVVLYSTATETVPALTSTATNENPESEFSFQQRGRWITALAESVQAADQAALDTEAAKRLAEGQDQALSVLIQHAPIAVNLMDAVSFRNQRAGLDFVAVCTALQVPLNPLDLMSGTYRKVSAR